MLISATMQYQYNSDMKKDSSWSNLQHKNQKRTRKSKNTLETTKPQAIGHGHFRAITHLQGVEVLTVQEFTIWEAFNGRELLKE